jgi:hypothetical protein
VAPAGKGGEDDLFGRGELPGLAADPALAGAPFLSAVEPGALDRIAGAKSGSAVDAGPVGEPLDEPLLAAMGKQWRLHAVRVWLV